MGIIISILVSKKRKSDKKKILQAEADNEGVAIKGRDTRDTRDDPAPQQPLHPSSTSERGYEAQGQLKGDQKNNTGQGLSGAPGTLA
jgi:hypothetical protein